MIHSSRWRGFAIRAITVCQDFTFIIYNRYGA